MNTDRQEAQELINLAIRLGPEDEGLDLTDREYNLEQLAALRLTLSTIRGACDIAANGLAAAWADIDPDGYIEMDGLKFWLGKVKGKRWVDDTSAFGFADWLKKQDVETIASILAPYGLKVGQIDKAARNTFLDETPGVAKSTIQNKPI